MADLFGTAPAQHDPGGKVRLKMLPGVRGAAEFSPCGRYRYWLSRKWGDENAHYALFLGENPSTASAEIDDPTIARELGITRSLFFTSYFKCNVVPYRCTDSRKLTDPTIELDDGNNLAHIARLAKGAGGIILTCGALPDPLHGRFSAILEVLAGCELWCRGITLDGWPRHGRGVRNDTPLTKWEMPAWLK